MIMQVILHLAIVLHNAWTIYSASVEPANFLIDAKYSASILALSCFLFYVLVSFLFYLSGFVFDFKVNQLKTAR